MSTISVVIPTYNSSKTISECLSAVYNSDYKDFEVIVVDDYSTDNTIEIIKKFPCKLIKLKQNSGPAKARNEGAKRARGGILFFIDSDVILLKNALKEVYNSYKDKEVVAVIGMYSKQPANKGFFQEYMALWKYYTWMVPKPPKFFSFFTGSCGSIKKEIFNEFNGFNTKYKGADVEDYELGYRINKKYKIKFNPNIQGKHYNPNFKSCIKSYYKRASQWFRLFLVRRKFDTGAASASRGFLSILALLILIIFLILPFYQHPLLLIVDILLITIFILSNKSFYMLSMKERGTLFMFGAIITNFMLSIAISLGAIRAIVKFNLKKLK